MCGRYTLTKRALRLAHRFTLKPIDETVRPETWNLAPSTLSVVVRGADTAREAAWLTWGFRNGPSAAVSPINARIETAASKPLFREAWEARRCVVPADGWYEWRLEHGRKQPYYLRRRDDEPLCFAGLWSGHTFCLLTTAADGPLTEIHHRRPLTLRDDEAAAWIDVMPVSITDAIQRAIPPAEIVFHPVSARVSNPRNDGPELIQEARVTRPEPEPDLFPNPQ